MYEREERRRDSISRQEVEQMMSAMDAKMNRLIDGAQAAIYINALLVGDKSMGLQGFIPETQERLNSFEQNAQKDRELYTSTSQAVTVQLSNIDTRLTRIESRRDRFRNAIRDLGQSALMTEGKVDFRKLLFLAGGSYEFVKLVGPRMAGLLAWAKKAIIATFMAWGK